MSMNELTWTCHVCKDERPDSVISVMSFDVVISKPGAPAFSVTQNVRYCNDRPECVAEAPNVRFLKENNTE
jgi:hypothetical protein